MVQQTINNNEGSLSMSPDQSHRKAPTRNYGNNAENTARTNLKDDDHSDSEHYGDTDIKHASVKTPEVELALRQEQRK